MSRSSWQRPDLLPLADRLRHLGHLRLFAVALVLLWQQATGERSIGPLAAGLVAIGVGLLAQHGQARWGEARGRWLFGVVLLVDAGFLAMAAAASGGVSGALRHLLVLQLVVVTLVASHRTGLKLALWHTLLALVHLELVQVGWIDAAEGLDPRQGLTEHLALSWAVAVVTGAAGAVNERELLRRRYDLDALARMAARFEQAEEADDVARILVDHVVDAFDPASVACFTLQHGEPLAVAGHGLLPVRRTPASRLLAQVQHERRTLLFSGLGEDEAWLADQLPHASRLVLLPLVADGRVEDVLVVDLGPRRGSQRVERRLVATLERFASHGALAIRNARLHAALVATAQTDGLTGVANRAAFDRRLREEAERVARVGGCYSLVLCDLDHFKQVNDQHGHLTGDAVLVAAAQALQATCRPYDLVGRYGGEEFVLLLPSTTAEHAGAVAERLRQSVERADTPVPVTTSVGVVTVHGSAEPQGALKAVDDALYAAKRGGRNRVVVASPVGPSAPSAAA